MLFSLLCILLSLIPAIIYIFFIKKIAKIKIKNSINYFISGIFSVGLLLIFFRLFPDWKNLFSFNNNILHYLFFSFIQIALVEETIKFTAFKINENIRELSYYDKPVETAFHCGITSLGFSFIENVDYAIEYGIQILLFRSILSMLIHFLCGFIMGYWISLKKYYHSDTSKNIINKYKYYAIGLFFATSIHGSYDFLLLISDNILYALIVYNFAIIILYKYFKGLIKLP